MPRGNGTGPMGMGAMTGRGMGFCAGYDRPGWRHFGDYGAPYGNWAPYSQDDPEMEKQALKTQANFLQSELDQIKKRLEDIESEKKA